MINLKNKNLEISLHLLTWLVLFFLPAAFSHGSNGNWKELFQHFWLQLFFLAVIFYINYFVLAKWLFSDKKVWFFVSNAILLILLVLLILLLHFPQDQSEPVVPSTVVGGQHSAEDGSHVYAVRVESIPGMVDPEDGTIDSTAGYVKPCPCRQPRDAQYLYVFPARHRQFVKEGEVVDITASVTA